MDEEIGCCGVFESAFSAFSEGRSKGTGHDYIIWRLCKDGLSPTRYIGFGGSEVRLNLGEALLCLSFVSFENIREIVGCLPFDILEKPARNFLDEKRRWYEHSGGENGS